MGYISIAIVMSTETIFQTEKPLRISTPTVVAAALWLIFFGSFIEPYQMTLGEKLVNYLFVQCGGMLLIFLSLRYFKYLKSYIRLNRGYWLLFPMLVIVGARKKMSKNV